MNELYEFRVTEGNEGNCKTREGRRTETRVITTTNLIKEKRKILNDEEWKIQTLDPNGVLPSVGTDVNKII